MNVARIASLNINGIRADTRVGMLQDFVRTHDLDVVLVQKFTAPESVYIAGYASHINIGSEMRWTTILARTDLLLTDIELLPSGRAIAAVFSRIRLRNVYAPSGTMRRTEEESFFNTEQPVLLSVYSHRILIGGFQLRTAGGRHHGPFHHQQSTIGICQRACLNGHVEPGPIAPYVHTLPQRGHKNWSHLLDHSRHRPQNRYRNCARCIYISLRGGAPPCNTSPWGEERERQMENEPFFGTPYYHSRQNMEWVGYVLPPLAFLSICGHVGAPREEAHTATHSTRGIGKHQRPSTHGTPFVWVSIWLPARTRPRGRIPGLAKV
jgi:hypothetical protein